MNTEKDVKYFHSQETHNLKAPGIIVPFLIEQYKPTSILDVGCGIGTFLYIFQKEGIEDILGIDGEWVDISKLYISRDKFKTADLESGFDLKRKFDLILCLEVAEHLNENAANRFIKSLTDHGDIIIFSAALPGQGGDNHLNEKPFAYWQKKFEQYDYFFADIFRERFWNNENVNWWYKQNMFLVVKKSKADTMGIRIPSKYFNDCFHPGCLNGHVEQKEKFRLSANQYDKIIKGKLSLTFYFKQLFKKVFKKSK